MTALNIRKNTANIMRLAASAVENAKLPDTVKALQKLNELRVRAAAILMPNDMAFVITPRDQV